MISLQAVMLEFLHYAIPTSSDARVHPLCYPYKQYCWSSSIMLSLQAVMLEFLHYAILTSSDARVPPLRYPYKQ